MSASLQETDRRAPSLDGWMRTVAASMAFLITALTTQIVRVSWFGPSAQPLSTRSTLAWRAAPSSPLALEHREGMAIIQELTSSAFADSARAILGAPSRPVGLVGPAGREARHIGEYIRSRDSVALAPSAIFSDAQLQHAFLHELSHHWMARHQALGTRLLAELPALTDSTRYGFGDADEHAAEALAHAVQFWRASQRGPDAQHRGRLLAAYESVMPGTRLAYLTLIEAGNLPLQDLTE
ncbi:MAG TPA: hypothetical protein VFO96_01645 [Gemmatimonadales bacterium]|nr:hypothetical protein [Gemmatimonadales bacterium]